MKQKVITRISRKSLFSFKSLVVLLFVLSAGFGILFAGSTIFSGAAQEIEQTENQIKNKSRRQPIMTRKSDEVFDRLIETARAGGTARVIVGLPIDFAPENDLTEESANHQRVEIGAAQNDLLNRLSPYAVEGVKQFEFIPFMAFEADAEALEFLKNSPKVNFIQEDKPYAASLAQSVSLVGATNAWNDGFTGNGQTIAILDSGVDKNHPLLTNKVVSEACYSTNANNAASFCPGGASSSTEVNSGLHCLGADGCQHGTHVAGIAAGRNGEANLNGVAKDANIIAVQVFTRFNDTANCDGMQMPCARYLPSDVIRGLERVYALRGDYNIAAVNLSLGGSRYYSACDAEEAATKTIIDNLRAAKIATIVASGNDSWTNSMDAPACISTAISVGSTRDGNLSGGNVDTVSAFSNSASFLSILAPGENINSSVPGGGYESYPGTSMASPHVAGAFAILKSRSPNSSVTQIFNALDATGIAVTDSRNNVTKKRIKIDAALNALPGRRQNRFR
jgi:subtilisin family serine protease